MATRNLQLASTTKRAEYEKTMSEYAKKVDAAYRAEDKETKEWVKAQNAKETQNKTKRVKFDIYPVYDCERSYTHGEVYEHFKVHGLDAKMRSKLQNITNKFMGWDSYTSTFNSKANAQNAVKLIKAELEKIANEKKASKVGCAVFKDDLKKLMKKHGITSLE